MVALHRQTIHSAILSLALTSAVAGCSSDEGGTTPGVNPAVVGTWNATSFVVGPDDLIALGMGMSFVFNNDGTYSLNFTNDQGGLCDPGEVNCSESGTYTASDTQILLDAGTVDSATLNYTISGSTMTVTATIDGSDITVVLDKA